MTKGKRGTPWTGVHPCQTSAPPRVCGGLLFFAAPQCILHGDFPWVYRDIYSVKSTPVQRNTRVAQSSIVTTAKEAMCRHLSHHRNPPFSLLQFHAVSQRSHGTVEEETIIFSAGCPLLRAHTGIHPRRTKLSDEINSP